jgi:prolyl oligopeptidase
MGKMIAGRTGLWLGTIAIFCGSLTGAFQASKDWAPNAARVSPVTDNYFGHSIVDPYRWMEDTNSPELLAWMAKQDEDARRNLNGLRCHTAFQKREREVQTETTIIDRVRRDAERYVYLKQAFATHTAALCLRDGLTGPEKLLASTSNSEYQDINEFDLSPDGRYVAYVASSHGRELGELRIVDANTGRPLPDVIKETRMVEPFMPDVTCFTGTWWAPDSHSFEYRRLGRDGSLNDSTVLLHTIGTETTKDLVLFGSKAVEWLRRVPGFPSRGSRETHLT